MLRAEIRWVMTSISIEFRPEHLNMKRYSFVRPVADRVTTGRATTPSWKVSTADSAGAFALMEDTSSSALRSGCNLHRQHAETFYISRATSISISTATG